MAIMLFSFLYGKRPYCIAAIALAALFATASSSQTFDPSWYDASLTYVKIEVEADGIYEVSGSQLAAAGVNLGAIDPVTLKLFESGIEIPIWFEGDPATMDPSDRIQFVGKMNTGDEEDWAYYETAHHLNSTSVDDLQSSDRYSLFTNTRTYWLTWSGPPGLRYSNEPITPDPGATDVMEVQQTFHTEMNFSRYDGDSQDSGHPYYTHGEGDYWHTFNQLSNRRDSVVVGLQAAPYPGYTWESLTFEARIVAGSAAPHNVILRIRNWGGSNGVYLDADQAIWTGYRHQTLTGTITQDQVYQFNGSVYVEIVAITDNYDNRPNKVYTDWFRVTGLRRLVARNDAMTFPSHGNGNYSYKLKGFSPGSVVILDPVSRQRFVGNADGNGDISLGDIGNPGGVYWAAGSPSILAPSTISVDGASDLANPANAADYLIIAPPGLRTQAQAVATFHTTHNGYSVMVVDRDEIFDQFDYGRPTPIAIRRFLLTTRTWSTPPRFLLLYGDARYAHPDRQLEDWEVPTYGFSSSDSWFAMELNGEDDLTEFLAIGRAPVRNNADAQIFLAKLQNYYSAPLSDWQQRAYFLTGGTEAEQVIFQNHSRNWATIAADEPAGMDTVFYFKTSNSTLDTSLRDSIRVGIRRGSSVLSYFGHSSSQTWEIVTDPASEFDNEDRLPLVLSFGCRTGAFAAGLDPAVDVRSLAEDLLISGESGAIGHWGTSELGTIGESSALATEFFTAVFPDTLRSVGEALQVAKNRYITERTGEWARRHALQYLLIGDPGVELNIATQPEFNVSQSLVTFDPVIPVTADSTVTLTLDLRNWGYYPSDSVSVMLTHTYPDNETEVLSERIEKFAIADTLTFDTRIADLPGIHTYQIDVDPFNEYDESIETNNSVTLQHLVFSNGVTIVYPENNSTTDRQPKLRVSIASQIEAGSIPVAFQLDTSPAFDSPELQQFNTTIADAHADWDITSQLSEGEVYYWRATADNPADPDATWAEAAFTVSTPYFATDNWMQQDELWLRNTGNTTLNWSADNGWEFVPYNVSVFAHSDRSGASPLSGQFQVNGDVLLLNRAGFGILILDGLTGAVKEVGYAVPYPNNLPIHQNLDAEIARLQALIDEIEPGDYFFVRTRHIVNSGGPDILETVKDMFRDVGSVAIDTLSLDHLWLMKGQLGNPSETEEMVVPPEEEEIGEISWTRKLVFNNSTGRTISPLIGPSQAWHQLTGDVEIPNATSSIVVDVLSEDGSAVLLEGLELSKQTDLSLISAAEHPYLLLRGTLTDESQESTPQLSNWRVNYTPIPDLVVDASSSTLPTEPLQEGQPVSGEIVIRNLGQVPVQSANLAIQLTDDENNQSTIHTATVANMPPDGSEAVSFEVPTFEHVGNNLLFAQAEQPSLPERIIYNNAVLRDYDVFADRTRPAVSVTIDDQFYDNMPGAVLDLQSAELPFVSATPRIEVVVNDENPYLQLDDPSSFQVSLDRLPLTSDQFTFTPATEGSNEARILFEPDLTAIDTVHTFTVRAKDATGNFALIDPTAEDSTLYQVHFRIQNALVIESLYPYPNPMSRNTRLMFRMGGSSASLIDDFRIRIYTVAGRLVREFDLVRNPDLLERGGLEIGWNSLPWDGTDEDGDPVASGVYLYKVFVRDVDGEEYFVNNATGIERIAVIR